MGFNVSPATSKDYEWRVTPRCHHVRVAEMTISKPTTPMTPMTNKPIMSNTAFVEAANLLGVVATRFGLIAPGFRTPPRIVGVQRTVRRRPGGGLVAVAVKQRPMAAVLADMIDGVIVVNELAPPESDTVRAALWSAVTPLLTSSIVTPKASRHVQRVA